MAGASWRSSGARLLADAYALDALALGHWGRAESPGAAPCKRTPGRVVARDPPPAGRPGRGARRGFVAVASIRHARCSQAGPGRRARDGAPRRLCARSPPGGHRLRTRAGCDALARLRRAADQLRHVGRRRRSRASRAGPATRRPDGSIHLPRDARPRAARVTGGALSRGHPAEAFAAAIARCRPACVVIDAVATEEGVAVPDVAASHAGWRRRGRVHGSWSMSRAPRLRRPLRIAGGAGRPPAVLAIESLTKHAQLGLDRVTAGAIYATNGEAAALDVLREHLGANIADASVHALPTPHRAVLARRLARHARNAGALARRMARAAPPGVVVAHRPPATWLTLRLGTAERATAFVDAALAQARERGTPLVEGASFGLDTTRVYAPSPGEGESCGFVRISAGIEHAEALERLTRVLVRALRGA